MPPLPSPDLHCLCSVLHPPPPSSLVPGPDPPAGRSPSINLHGPLQVQSTSRGAAVSVVAHVGPEDYWRRRRQHHPWGRHHLIPSRRRTTAFAAARGRLSISRAAYARTHLPRPSLLNKAPSFEISTSSGWGRTLDHIYNLPRPIISFLSLSPSFSVRADSD